MIKTLELILLLVILFLMNEVAKADTITTGLIGGTYFSEPSPDKAVVSPEFNFTYEKRDIFYNLAILNLEKDVASFTSGVGTRWQLSDEFYLGFMGSFVFKKYDRPAKTNAQSLDIENFIPLTHRVSFQPFVTVEKYFNINDTWSVSMQAYFNHVASHGSIGVRYNLGE